MAGISAFNQVLYSPAPLAAKTSALISILNQKRFLIILDNFESCLDQSHQQIADLQLRQMIEALLNATASNTKFIITTRYDFDPLQGRLMNAIERLSVPEMPLYQAIWLMNNFTNLAALSYEKKKEIHRAIGGHPWTIGMFAHHATTATVDGLLLELGPLEQELMDFTLFDRSYSELDEQARDLLIRASILEDAVPVEALRWMMGDDEEPSPSVDRPLGMLLSSGLAARQEESDGAMYSFHTKVRDFAGREAKAERKRLQVRAAQFYERQAKEDDNIWDHLRARDYYYRAEEWEKAAGIVIAAWGRLSRWGYIELAMRLLKESEDTVSGVKKATVTGNLAILYQNLGDWKTALKMISQAKEIFENLGDERNIAACLHQLGTIHQDHGNYDDAAKFFQDSLDILEILGDKLNIIACLYHLGGIYKDQGNYIKALEFFSKSIDLAKELGDKRSIAAIILQVGNICWHQGKISQALELYKQSLDLAQMLGDKQIAAPVFHHMGIIHRLKGEYAKSAELFQHSLDLNEELGNRLGIAADLHEMGIIHKDQGNSTEAVKLYEQSLEIKRELGDRSGIAATLHQLGMIHHFQGDYPKAVKLYEQSLEIAMDLGNRLGIALTLGQMGRIKEESKDFEGALRDYITARSIFEELKSPYIEMAMKDIARLRETMGEEAFQEALSRLGGSS